jgi:hypothetical protein
MVEALTNFQFATHRVLFQHPHRLGDRALELRIVSSDNVLRP